MQSFNLAAAMIQVFWIGISTVAITLRPRCRGQAADDYATFIERSVA